MGLILGRVRFGVRQVLELTSTTATAPKTIVGPEHGTFSCGILRYGPLACTRLLSKGVYYGFVRVGSYVFSVTRDEYTELPGFRIRPGKNRAIAEAPVSRHA